MERGLARGERVDPVSHVGVRVASPEHERSWFIVHTDRGAVLLGLWYRRPARGEVASIASLYAELRAYGSRTIYTIIMGGMNVHEASWLWDSDGTSEEGRCLLELSNITGLEERARQPT